MKIHVKNFLAHLDRPVSGARMAARLNVFAQKSVTVMETLLALDQFVGVMGEIIQTNVS